MKKMNSTLHGILDYATVAMWQTLPSLMKLSAPHVAFMRAFGGAFLGLSLTTKYPLPASKYIPFIAHGVIETGTALVFLGLSVNPLLKKRERLFYLASGLQLGTMVLLSDYKNEASKGEPGDSEQVSQPAGTNETHIPSLETQHNQQIREEQEAVQGVKQVMETMGGESKITDDETDEGMPYRSVSETQNNFAPERSPLRGT